MRILIAASFVTALCLAAPLSASAERAPDSTGLSASTADAGAPKATDMRAAALDDKELADVAGGENAVLVQTTQNLEATSSGNTINADNVQSGGVSFSDNALAGFNGIGNFVINTGNNNTLQGSLSVTVITAGP